MRARLIEDLLNLDDVAWVALIGPDALPIHFSPPEQDVRAAVAMWIALDVLVEDTPARMMVRTNEAVLLSHRVDEDRLLMIRAELNANLGSLRSELEGAAERIIDLA